MAIYEFAFKTGKVVIDHERCKDCESFACVKACSLFGGSLFRIEGDHPVLIASAEEAGRRCIEDLSCELYCQEYGNKGLNICLDPLGLDKYRQKIGLH